MTSPNMQRALALARRGGDHTSPNPMVGAVITDDTGHVIAEGYHQRVGGPHAEVDALRKAPGTHGGTLYVTLEPCNHQGRTPPCTEAIIRSGIKRVVIATLDPNPHVTGGGVQRLRQAGIAVSLGDGADEAEDLNHAFFTWSRHHRPWITLKAAMSLDGKIADRTGASKYLTSQGALQHAHQLRREHDAILVGSGTVLMDNPRLTYRGSRRASNPIRVVLDSRGRVPAQALVFHADSPTPTLVFASQSAPVEWERALFSVGAEVIRVGTDADGHVSLVEVVQHLGDRRLLSVLVEGGPTIHAAFLEHNLVDRWVGYVAPLILGGTLAQSASGGRGFLLKDAPRFTIKRVLRRGPDVVIEAAPLGNPNEREVP